MRTPSQAGLDPHIWMNRLLCVVFGTLVALIVAEIAVRVLDINPTGFRSKQILRSRTERHWICCYSSNPNREFVPTPKVDPNRWELVDQMWQVRPFESLKETPWCIDIKMSAQELRDREFSEHPTTGVVRIACVGDSFVFGEGVPVELTLPKQIEAMLGSHTEVLNFGFPDLELIRKPFGALPSHKQDEPIP